MNLEESVVGERNVSPVDRAERQTEDALGSTLREETARRVLGSATVLLPAVATLALSFAMARTWWPSQTATASTAAVNSRDAPIQVPPHRIPLLSIAGDEWRNAMEAFHPIPRTDDSPFTAASTLLHFLKLQSSAAAFTGEQLLSTDQVVEALTNDACATIVFGAPTLHRTRYGARFQPPAVLFEMRTLADEAHPDQNLAALAQLGVPLSHPLKVGGQAMEIRDVLTDLIANFSLDQIEVEWTAISLSLYLPPEREWTDKFGVRTSFDDLARVLTRLEPERQSCAGTHVFQAMALLWLADQAIPVLTKGAKAELLLRLNTFAKCMSANQRPDGTWDAHWFREPGSSLDNHQEVDSDCLLVTGHLTEFALYLPAGIRPPDEVLRLAGEWLWSRVRERTTDDPSWFEHFCPWTHAVCAVNQLKQ